MKVKLDENLGTRTARLFSTAGHDVATVHDQGMDGASDDELYAVCLAEERMLVSLDLDFANPFRFDPAPSAGLAVLRVSEAPSLAELETVVSRLLDAATAREVRGRLWVVDSRRVREYRPADPETNG